MQNIFKRELASSVLVEMKKRICIIGAGTAGLGSLLNVMKSQKLQGTLFEQSNHIGGLWHISDSYNSGPREVPSSPMYKKLRANVPKQIMHYAAFPIDESKYKDTYLEWSQVRQYLEDFTAHYKLRKYIVFNTKVILIKPKSSESSKWLVQVKNLITGKIDNYEFDGVMICNGKNTEPIIPKVKGLEKFKGDVIHSKNFKDAGLPKYANKNVVCLGLGPSSLDISLHLADKAKNVFISSKNYGSKDDFQPPNIPKNCKIVPKILQMGQSEAFLSNDEQVPCDVLILCTGYQLSFPFLDPECGVEIIDGKYVRPLYKLLLHAKKPTLCFIGLPLYTAEHFTIEIQSMFYTKFMDGSLVLPEIEQRFKTMEEFELEQSKAGLPMKKFNIIGQLGLNHFDYLYDLAKDGKFEQIYCPQFPLYKALMSENFTRLYNNTLLHKKDVIEKLDDRAYLYIQKSGGDQQNETKVKFSISPDGIVKMVKDSEA